TDVEGHGQVVAARAAASVAVARHDLDRAAGVGVGDGLQSGEETCIETPDAWANHFAPNPGLRRALCLGGPRKQAQLSERNQVRTSIAAGERQTRGLVVAIAEVPAYLDRFGACSACGRRIGADCTATARDGEHEDGPAGPDRRSTHDTDQDRPAWNSSKNPWISAVREISMGRGAEPPGS